MMTIGIGPRTALPPILAPGQPGISGLLVGATSSWERSPGRDQRLPARPHPESGRGRPSHQSSDRHRPVGGLQAAIRGLRSDDFFPSIQQHPHSREHLLRHGSARVARTTRLAGAPVDAPDLIAQHRASRW